MKLNTWAVWFITFMLIMSATVISWADESAYYINPLKMMLPYKPNQDSVVGSIRVYSTSNQPITLHAVAKNWSMAPNGSLLFNPPEDKTYPASENLRISPDQFELLPHHSQLVRYAFHLPPDRPQQEFHAQVAFEQINLPSLQMGAHQLESAIRIVNNFSTTLYIYPTSATADAKIKTFDATYEPNKKEIALQAVLTNEGLLHTRLKTKLILSPQSGDKNGPPIAVLTPLGDTTLVVLPGKDRLIHQSVALDTTKPLAPGTYQAQLQFMDERNIAPAVSATQTIVIP